jgi:Ca2+-binding RTX toxin-like protein
MIGGKGNDTYDVNDAGDQVIETLAGAAGGVDTVRSRVSFDLSSLIHVENVTLAGVVAIDATGNALNNVLIGNDGANRLDGGAGNDTMTGGKGDDTYVVNAAGDVVQETVLNSAGGGVDTVESAITFSLAPHTNIENLTLAGGSAINGTGNALDNVLTGNSATNILDGGTGNDLLFAAAGNDTLLGGEGDDLLSGGLGNDAIDGGAGAKDLLDYSNVSGAWSFTLGTGGLGTATLEGTDTYKGVEGAIGGDGANNIAGNTGDNFLRGRDGADTLSGGGGTDVLEGEAGDDLLVFTNAQSTYVGGTHDGGNDLASVIGDTLDIAGVASLDLTLVESARFAGLETLNMTGGGGTTLTLSFEDVIDLGDGTFLGDSIVDPDLDLADAVRIDGGADDVVNLQAASGSWQDVTATIGNSPAGHQVYAYHTAGNVLTAYAVIDSDITINAV